MAGAAGRANVVQQRGVGDGGGPGFGLCRLVFGAGADGQQMGLPQFQTVGDDFEAVVEHAAQIGMVMRLGGREGLDQLGVAFQGRSVQRGELPARQRGALPNVLQQLLPARGGQQRCGRLGPHQPFREDGGGCWRWRAGDRGPFSLEQGEHAGVLWRADREAFLPFRGRAFPLAPHSLAVSALWPLTIWV